MNTIKFLGICIVFGLAIGLGLVAVIMTSQSAMNSYEDIVVECPLDTNTWTPFPCYECPKEYSFTVQEDAECILLITHTAWIPSSNEPRNKNEVIVYLDGKQVFHRQAEWPEQWGMISQFYTPGITRNDLVGTTGNPDTICLGNISSGTHTLSMEATEENYHVVDGIRILLLH